MLLCGSTSGDAQSLLRDLGSGVPPWGTPYDVWMEPRLVTHKTKHPTCYIVLKPDRGLEGLRNGRLGMWLNGWAHVYLCQALLRISDATAFLNRIHINKKSHWNPLPVCPELTYIHPHKTWSKCGVTFGGYLLLPFSLIILLFLFFLFLLFYFLLQKAILKVYSWW